MGILIQATAVGKGSDGFSAVENAAHVGEMCIQRAGLSKASIDVLINTGVYKDQNRIEPATAAFIQKQMEVNADPLRDTFDTTTFSFDLCNGSCSFLHAVQVANALAQSAGIRLTLVICSNATSSVWQDEEEIFSRVAAAALLAPGRQDEGFRNIKFFSDHGAPDGMVGFCDPSKNVAGAHAGLTVFRDAEYGARLRDYASKRAVDYVDDQRIDVNDISLVVSSCPCEGFGHSVARALGIETRFATDFHRKFGDLHASALMLGYDAAAQRGTFSDGATALFVEAGPPTTVAFALYTGHDQQE